LRKSQEMPPDDMKDRRILTACLFNILAAAFK